MNKNIIRQYCIIIKNKISQARFESALESINKLLYNFPKNEYGYYYKGVCEFAMEKYEDALKNYIRAIKLQPAFAKAYFNLGVCLYMLNKYDSALINIGKALIVFSKQKDSDAKERCIEALKFIESERNGLEEE